MPTIVIAGIIAAGGAVGAAAISANAQKSASQTAAAGTQAALTYQEQKDAQDRADAITAQNANYQQYLAKTARLAPYLQSGAGASAMLQKGLGLPQVALPANPPPPQFTSTFNAPGTPTTPTTGPAAVGGMVTLRAPNGQTQQVPQSQAAYYQQKGATVVQ